ncbi:MAG TPA: flavin reductase family protein [Mycobacteriales bacterium]|nr:flavin reductase family protein [Mycobacteriales bacterium]
MESAAREPEHTAPSGRGLHPRAVERGPVGQRRFREAMSLFPTGVTLLTTRAVDGTDHGMTVNSFTSVSLDPVLVLVSVEHASRLHDAVLGSGLWGVSVLGEDAEHLSRRFARRGHDTTHALAEMPHHRGRRTGALLLDSALATFECRTRGAHPGGDHTVLVGEVLALATPSPQTPPLVWYRGRYVRIADAG